MNKEIKMDKKVFKVEPVHLKLLRRACIDWDDSEFGAPCIDPKRPYGNSDICQDMIEILGLKTLKEGIYEFKLNGRKWLLKGEDKYNIYLEGADEDELCNILLELHQDLEVVLQIVLVTGTFKPGNYEAEKYSNKWKLIKK